MDSNQDFGNLLNNSLGSSPQQPKQASGDVFGSLLNNRETARTKPTEIGGIKGIAAQEGAEHLLPVISALYGQESGSGANQRTSIDGAQGGMQIIPATFQRFAKPGERIDNPDDNMRVGVRIIKSLGDKFGNDPAKIATAYFSGEGNVNPGQGTAWKDDRADGNGKRVSGYVSDVLKRIGVDTPSAQPQGAPDLSKAPKWADVEAKPEFKALSPEKQAQTKAAYFDHWIAPRAGEREAELREKFLAAKAEPGFMDKALGVAKDIGGAVVDAVTPSKSVLEGQKFSAAPDLPTTSRVPVRPEVRAAFKAQWDAATPEQRSAMAQREDWVGMLAKERTGVFERQDANNLSAAQGIDTRVEARRSRLIAQGESPEFADRAAREAAAAGVMPGREVDFINKKFGTAQQSNFDFETKQLFDQEGGTNGLNNPISRGLTKGGLGISKFVAGYGEFLSDALGLENAGESMRDGGDWARGKEQALGESGSYLERNFEGAISSIAQQLPLLITGTKLESEAIPLAGMALQSFGQEYSDGRAAGQSVGEATTRASIFAAFEVVGEKFGLKESMQAIKAAARGLPSDQILGFLWSALKKEVPGEILTTTGQFATDKLPGGVGLNPNATGADYLQQVADTIVQTIMQSGVMAGGTTGVSKAVRYVREDGKTTTDTDAELVRQQALNKWNTNGLNSQLRGTPTQPNATPDGRVEPSLDPEPTAHPTTQAAEDIVRELAADAGIPLETVLPSAATPSNRVETVSDADVLDLAASRYQQLREKQNGSIQSVVGESGMVDQDVAGVGLSAAEQQEFNALQQAGNDPQALRQLYGFDLGASTQSDPGVTPPGQEALTDNTPDIASQSNVSEGDAMRALGFSEQEIQAATAPKQERQQKETANGTQAPQAQQTETQRQESPAATEPGLTSIEQKNLGPDDAIYSSGEFASNSDEAWFNTETNTLATKYVNGTAVKHYAGDQSANGLANLQPIETPEDVRRAVEDGKTFLTLAEGSKALSTKPVEPPAKPKTEKEARALKGKQTASSINSLPLLKTPDGSEPTLQVTAKGRPPGQDTLLGYLPISKLLAPENIKRAMDVLGASSPEMLLRSTIPMLQQRGNVLAEWEVRKILGVPDQQAPNPQGAEPTAPLELNRQAFQAPTFKERVLKAYEFARKVFSGKKVRNQSDGGEIIIPQSGIKHALSGKVSEAALAAFEKLDQLIANATYVSSEPDKAGRNTIKEVRIYESPVRLDGVDSTMRVIVRVAHDGSRYYDHFEIRGQEKAPAGQPGKQDKPDSLQPFTGAVATEATTPVTLSPNSKSTKSEPEKSQQKDGDKNTDDLRLLGRRLSEADESAREKMTPRETGVLKVFEGSATFSTENLAARFIKKHDLSQDHFVIKTDQKRFKVVPNYQSKTFKDFVSSGKEAEFQKLLKDKKNLNEDQYEEFFDLRTERINARESDEVRRIDEALSRVSNKPKSKTAFTSEADSADAASKAKAQKDLDDALSDLSMILTKGARKNITPEQEQALLPVLTKVMDAAFRLGYLKFKDAAKFVLDTIRAKLGGDAADMLTLDHLQGAYIGMAGKYRGTGADTAKAVVAVESKDEIEAYEAKNVETVASQNQQLSLANLGAQEENSANANPVQTETVPPIGAGEAEKDVTLGNRDSQQVGAGVAAGRGGADQGQSVSGGTEQPGTTGTRSAQQPRDVAPGSTRNSAGIRPESVPSDADHVIDAEDIGKGGLAQKYRDNITAIKILKALENEGRVATPEERKSLSKYVGWGAMKGPFDPENKQWAKQHEELKNLLTPEEFRAARKSTLDAHYTSPVAVGAMFEAVQRLGFSGGRVLEPSVGSGNFFGLMPREMRTGSNLHGVELDSLTSRLVAALYPKAKIAKATGFEDFEIPSEYFDLVIGNPPFGSQPLVDKERSPYSGLSIHNYFLAKGIDKLRPGGIMQVIVSHNFLDAQDDRARKWIGERANLIAAVRLPNTAFKENAGTEVVTDILIFQKKTKSEYVNGIDGSISSWQKVVEQTNVNPKTGESATHKVNQFFVANPSGVLGTPSAGGTMYAANEYTVQANGDLKDQLAGWVQSLPKNIYEQIDRKADNAVVDMAVPDGLKVGSFYVDSTGKVMQRGNDVMGEKTAYEWEPKNESAKKRMVGMIGLRDSLRKQMRLERSLDANEAEIEANRVELNRLYDDFLKKFGHLNNQTNRRIFLDDTESQLLQALEFDFDKGISKATAEKEGIEEREASAVKADIFKRRVAFPPQDFLTVESAKDALLASLNYRGKVDSAYMAEVYGKPMAEIVAELGDVVYDDPQLGIVTADEYLAGDVKTKLTEAKAAAQDNPKYKRNVDALEKVIPKDKKPSEISVSIGASFVPAGLYQQFVKHISGDDSTAAYIKATGQWIIAFGGHPEPALNTAKFGTSELSAQELFELTIMGRGAVVKKTYRAADGSTTTVLLEKETEAARDKQNTIKAEWQSWLWRDPVRADKLAALYNEKMNRIVERKFDGQHLSFPGMNPAISLLEHQKNGVWRGLQSYQVLYDHVVGAGKTFEMATLAMEMRRLGIARKPLFVVPNHLTLQWRSEFTRLYPGSNILAATPEDFSADRRERMFSKIITGDWDAVVIGHSSLKKIGLPEETERAVLQEQIDEVASAVEEMKRSRGDRNIIRDMEKIRSNLEAKMKDKLSAIGKRSKVVTFNELGIDAMFIDEMHEFKNLAYNTTMDRNPGMGNPNGSAKAFDLFVKTRWLFDTFGEKTPYITATGTPVSNSLVEMFNMQRYVQYPTLKKEGLHVFDAWAKQFGSVENVYEVAPSGAGYRQSTRFAKFTNLPGLMGLYNTFADTITLDDLRAQEEAQGKRFPVPKMVGGRPVLVVAKRSPAVAALMGMPEVEMTPSGDIKFELDLNGDISIAKDSKGEKFVAKAGNNLIGNFETEEDARLKIVELAMSPKVTVSPDSILGRFANLRELTKKSKGKINALSLTSEANKAGLDYRLIDPRAADFPGSKINLAVDNMIKVYKQWAKDKGTQLVFCDMSIPLSARASYSSKERRLYVRTDTGAIEMKRGTMHTVPGFESLPFFIVQKGAKDSKKFDVYDAATGALIDTQNTKAEAKEGAAALISDENKRQRWIDKRESAGEISQEQIDDYNNDNDVETENSEAFTREDIAGVSGAAAFSVYDDIKAKLIDKGIPEREIAFIHDYSTPVAKDKLFKAVNAGDIRFLLGSTPKMGAGTNVQKRLVGLHHIDAPWRPSDLEQREGRIIRRGNELYERDPEGFEVFVGRYATEQTYDTRRWQILEHKARGIEQLRNFDGTINEIDDIEGEAANSADMKAAASGDPMILEETQLRNEVKRLERLQAAHADEILVMMRKAQDNEQYAETYGPRLLKEVDGLIETLSKNPIDSEGWANITVDGKVYKDKESAGEAIGKATSVVRAGMADEAVVLYRGIKFLFSRVGTSLHADAPTAGVGFWGADESFSGTGFITRMVNYAARLQATKVDITAKIEKANKDVVALREQAKVPFAQINNLESARENHKKVQRALLAKGPDVPENQKEAVAQGIKEQRAKLEQLGFGDALREFYANDNGQTEGLTEGQRTLKDFIRPSALNDFSSSPSISFTGVPELVRVNARQKLEKLGERLDKGEITEAEFVFATREITSHLNDQKEERDYRRAISARRRGYDWVVAQLRRYVANEMIEREVADFAEWLLNQNPNLATDLGIGITSKENAAGDYNDGSRVFRLVVGKANPGTAVHEILHHSERMMPPEVQDGVLREWQRAWTIAYKNGDKKLQKALLDMVEASLGSQAAYDRVQAAFNDGTLVYDKHYQLYSPSEFWAVNATRILSGRYAAKGSWIKRAVQWFKEFIQRIKAVFGLPSDAPVLKALKSVVNGNGQFKQDARMLVDRAGDNVGQEVGDRTFNDFTRKTQNNLIQFFGNRNGESIKTFGGYDKTLSTQYNKALKDKHFGKVFAYVNAMQNEVSLTSLRPAELAPGVLPRVDDVRSALATMVKGKKSDTALQHAAQAVFDGTLDGEGVMQGKVWTHDEFMDRPGATEASWALYQQTRAAIDASLDEVAAAEAYAMAQGFVPKALRRVIIDNPSQAEGLIVAEIKKQMKTLKLAIKGAKAMGALDQQAELESALSGYQATLRNIETIFTTANNLKKAGYAPLMRFGKYTVNVQYIDPETGNVARDDNGEPMTLFYGQFQTEGEALGVRAEMQEKYGNRDDVRVSAGTKSQTSHELYAGISPETLALFAEAIGADTAMRKYIELAMNERSALKRRLSRKGTEGYSDDLSRVLSNFITSNGRHAAQRYYLRDLNNAIKYIPKEKGDVLDEAMRLKQFVLNPKDDGASMSSLMFAWFLGGSVASAVVNLTQPVMMTAPYLSQFGVATSTKALAKALPYALGRKQMTDMELRAALKRASQEGIVDAQEIFHLYSVGAQGVASNLASSLSRLPGVGRKIKSGGDDARARINAFLTLWGSMFALAEGFNRRLTFIAAWEVAKTNGERNPYAFAVRAVNETQGIYNKVNRPNWGRGFVGRTILTFKQFSLMYLELLSRMWKRGGPEGKRAALVMLAVLMLAAGEEGLPFAQDLDDLIDTVGQMFGLDTNMKRNKRRWAHEILGKELGDLFLYGVSSQLPLDFAGRLGLGNLIPGTGLLKPSNEQGRVREIAEVVGPSAGLSNQIGDAYDAAVEGNTGKAWTNLAPKAVKDVLAAAEMAKKGYSTDTKGRKVVDVDMGDAAVKSLGFNPTKVAQETRKTTPVYQDIALQKRTESSIVNQWVRGLADNDMAMAKDAQQRLSDWNRLNPGTPIQITPDQIRSLSRQMATEKNARLLKLAPREMRGQVGLDLAK